MIIWSGHVVIVDSCLGAYLGPMMSAIKRGD